MNISYNWLKDLVDFDLNADELAVKLTDVGLAVEGIHAHDDDFILNIDLTSNRPDCLSHLGVAREIAGPETRPVRSVLDEEAASRELVSIADPELCRRFTARVIRNVKVSPSPRWLADRLESLGERSINNIADITNYVMLELGQPMHAFDLDKLTENRLVVRRAKSGESITTLDEIEHELDATMLAICDAEKPVAIAGIMGGLDSSITKSTVNVLLEVAYFDRANIRATSRKLNLATESSYRFERGVDIDNLRSSSDRAAELMCEFAGGELGEFLEIYPNRSEPRDIAFVDLPNSVRRLTGLDVSADRCVEILASLGISRTDKKTFRSPSWRHDLEIEEDLVEEVARHIGYDKIAAELPPALGAGEYQATELREKKLRDVLAGLGFDEALSYSFVDTRFDEDYELVPGVVDEKQDDKFVTLKDAIIAGAVRMRPSLLPGLLDGVRLNLNHQRRDLKLFEIGNVFANITSEDRLPNEQKLLAMVLTGSELLEDRSATGQQFDFYDASGAVEAAFEAIGAPRPGFVASNAKHLRAGQSAEIRFNDSTVGYVGRLDESISSAYKFKQPVFVAEISLETILAAETPNSVYRPLSKYPSVTRDVSLIVKRSQSFAEIHEAILEQNYQLLRSVLFVDTYEGKGVAEDERSVTIRLEYRSEDRTLVEGEVEAVHEQVLSSVESKLAVRRQG